MTKELCRDENLYVRLQATVPLLELASHRWRRMNTHQFSMDQQTRQQVKDLAKEMVEANADYPRLLEWAARSIQFIRDISDKDARQLLALLATRAPREARNSIALELIYFAVYREDHFPELGLFDSMPLKNQLAELIQLGPAELRATLAWQLAGRLKDAPEDFERLRGFVYEIPKGDYDRAAFGHFFRIAKRFLPTGDAGLRMAFERAKDKREKVDPWPLEDFELEL